MDITFATALAHPRDGWGHMYDDDWSGWMWLWGSLMMLFWVAVIALTVWFVSRLAGGRAPSGTEPRSTERAQGILAERFARGEIDTEEYEHRLSKLG